MEKATTSMTFFVDNVEVGSNSTDPTAWFAETKGSPKEHTFPSERFNRYHDMNLDYIPPNEP